MTRDMIREMIRDMIRGMISCLKCFFVSPWYLIFQALINLIVKSMYQTTDDKLYYKGKYFKMKFEMPVKL